MELMKEVLALVIYAVITGAGVVLVKAILDYINTSIDDIQKNTKLVEYEVLNRIIDRVQVVVTTIVQAINQEFVADIKASGKFTKELAVEAKNKALNTAKELITDEAANAIEQVYGDVDEYLGALIEQIVAELKK